MIDNCEYRRCPYYKGLGFLWGHDDVEVEDYCTLHEAKCDMAYGEECQEWKESKEE